MSFGRPSRSMHVIIGMVKPQIRHMYMHMLMQACVTLWNPSNRFVLWRKCLLQYLSMDACSRRHKDMHAMICKIPATASNTGAARISGS